MVLTAVTASILLGTVGFAQSGTTDEGKRRVKTRISPLYPELAKRMNVTVAPR
jgi:hypothetical protein